jgi:hypothetical protein
MGNVVEFGVTKADAAKNDIYSRSDSFTSDHLIPWAISQGIDVHSKKFQINGATIVSCIQGMLLDDI